MTSSNSACRDFGWDQVDPFDEKDNHLWMKLEHLGRYLFAADFLKQHQPSVVADISCGIGYGIPELGRIAQMVIGVDSSKEMIEIASKKISDGSNGLKVRFLNKDLDSEDLTPDIEPGSVDAVVSFETLEHLIDPNRAVSQFSHILKPHGFFICSVPNALSESKASACCPKEQKPQAIVQLRIVEQNVTESRNAGGVQIGAVVVLFSSQKGTAVVKCQADRAKAFRCAGDAYSRDDPVAFVHLSVSHSRGCGRFLFDHHRCT